jgi:hypothetical protein
LFDEEGEEGGGGGGSGQEREMLINQVKCFLSVYHFENICMFERYYDSSS